MSAALRTRMVPGREYGPAELRDVLGFSRKFLIPFLEWSDKTGLTERRAAGRVLAARAAPAGAMLNWPLHFTSYRQKAERTEPSGPIQKRSIRSRPRLSTTRGESARAAPFGITLDGSENFPCFAVHPTLLIAPVGVP